VGGAASTVCTDRNVSPPSQPSPIKGEGEKIRRLQAAHGVTGAFGALTQQAPGFAEGRLTATKIRERAQRIRGKRELSI